MAVTLTISSAQTSTDGLTVTCNVGGVTGSLVANAAVTGLTVTMDGAVVVPTSAVVSGGSTLSLFLPRKCVVRTIVTVQLASTSNLVDTSGDTATNGNATAVANLTYPLSPYLSFLDFLTYYGIKNVSQASNKDANATAVISSVNNAAVQMAFDWAADQINKALSSSRYKVPLDFTPGGGMVPSDVTRWTMVLAYYDLMVSRGIHDPKSPAAGMAKQVEEVRGEMRNHVLGFRDMPAVQTSMMTPQTTQWVDVIRASVGFRFVDGVPVWYSLN